MMNKDKSEINNQPMSDIISAIYTDFMPMVQDLKNDFAKLNLSETDRSIAEHISLTLSRSENLLKQIKGCAEAMSGNGDFFKMFNIVLSDYIAFQAKVPNSADVVDVYHVTSQQQLLPLLQTLKTIKVLYDSKNIYLWKADMLDHKTVRPYIENAETYIGFMIDNWQIVPNIESANTPLLAKFKIEFSEIATGKEEKRVIECIKDTAVKGFIVTTFPYKFKGNIIIVSKKGKQIHARFPAWGEGREILKFDENHVYMKSDIADKIDVFDSEGVKVKEIGTVDI